MSFVQRFGQIGGTMNEQKGFTLVELIAVVVIIAVIAAIAIPGILNARKAANTNAAFASIKAFCNAMIVYQNDDLQQKYPADSSKFGKYFSQPANNTKNGYMYYYFTSENQTHYIYIAFPVNANNSRKAYFVDESNRVWEGDSKKDTVAPYPAGYVPGNPATPPLAPAEEAWEYTGPNRLTWIGVNPYLPKDDNSGWVQKN